jgi:arylsulfatase A-like enzyme
MRYVDPNIFVNPSEEMEFEFGPEFHPTRLSTGAAARVFVQHATLKLKNSSGAAKSVQLRFAGGVFQQRVELVRQNYAAEVQYVDKYIGELWDRMDKLGLLDNTIIVLTADHGEGLKTHGTLGHVERLYQETTHVPLIVYYPHLGKRGSVATPIVNHLDIMPTVLDLLHVKYKGVMRGLSLKHYISWSPIDWITSNEVTRPRTFTATYAPEARVNSFAMLDGQMKLIHTPNKSKWQWEAYDLKQDTSERKNLAAKDVERFNNAEVLRLRRMLEEFRTDAEAAHSKRINPKISREDNEMFKGLGYIGGDENGKPYTHESKEKDQKK